MHEIFFRKSCLVKAWPDARTKTRHNDISSEHIEGSKLVVTVYAAPMTRIVDPNGKVVDAHLNAQSLARAAKQQILKHNMQNIDLETLSEAMRKDIYSNPDGEFRTLSGNPLPYSLILSELDGELLRDNYKIGTEPRDPSP